MNGIELYNKLKTPDEKALSPISGGNLNGYTNINPQWRIQAMTEVYGSCGVGWKFEKTDEKTYACPDGKLLLYLEIALYIRNEESGHWSEPIYGWGGDFILQKNKNGLVANDEAYKMALTDALGNAMKCLGVGADVYMGLMDGKGKGNNGNFDGSKYSKQDYYERRESGPAQQSQQKQPVSVTPERRNDHGELLITQAQQKRLFAIAGRGNENIVKDTLFRYGYVSSAEVTRRDYNKICEEIQEQSQGDVSAKA